MNQRLVDANKIMDYLDSCCHYSDSPDYDIGYSNGINVAWDRLLKEPGIDPVHHAGGCYCKECKYYESFRNYPDCSKTLPYGYCYYWDYEVGESPNSVDEDDFCSKGVINNA